MFGEESGFMMIAGDTTSSDSPVLGSIVAESPAGSDIPSLDLVTRSGFQARAKVGVVNPSKIMYPRISVI